MAYSLVGFMLSLEAAADLSSSQYCAVNVDTSGEAALPSAGGRIIGVLQNDPTAGKEATIQIAGVSKMILAGTVAAGDWVKVDAAGKAVATAVAGDEVVGICLVGGAVGNTGSVLLLGPGFVTLP
jgi:hypothetical protein